MKILTWNCNGALRNKFHLLDKFDGDILVIQECENPSETKDSNYKNWAENHLWIGDSKNKGIGIFAKKNIKLSQLSWSNTYKDHTVKYFLPFTVNEKITFLGIWTHKNNSPNFGYIGQLWKYIQINKSKLENSILIGDFNSNKKWDEWDRWWNHSDVVRELSEIGLVSLYHHFTNEEQGKESNPTFYLQKNINKPYHIDYCFAPKNLAKDILDLKVGDFNDWKTYSDHTPIIIEINI